MASPLDRLNDFRGTRTAQAISVALFLALGAYDVLLGTGPISFAFGVLLLTFGVLGLYKLVAGESLAESITS